MEEKIIEELHFYGIEDEEYKKRCLEVVYDINNNEVLKNKVEELFYKLYDRNKEGLSKYWKMKKVSELFGDCNLFITSVMILLGCDIHRKNMSKYNLSDEQKSIHIKRVKCALLDDNEIEKALNSIIIEDKIFKGTLQPNEVHSCYLKISFDGNELPKGNIKLNLNIKYIFVQD